MSIQGISPNAPINTSAQQADPRLKNLEQQINVLKKQLMEVRNDQKLNAKVKEEKIKEIEKKIQILEQEKTQIQAEERQKKQKKTENDQSTPDKDTKNKNSVVDENVQNAFVKMETMKNSKTALGIVREQAEGELRIAESKSFLRTPNPEAAANAREKLATIDGYVLRKGAEVTKELKDASYKPVSAEDKQEQEEIEREKGKRGSGRMEPGQFLDDEA